MLVRIEELRNGRVETTVTYENPMWIKVEFVDFTLQISERQGIAVVGLTDADLALHPRADNQVEIVKRK